MRVSEGFWGSQWHARGVPGGFQSIAYVFRDVSIGFRGFQEHFAVFMGFQRVSAGLRHVPVVLRSYKGVPGVYILYHMKFRKALKSRKTHGMLLKSFKNLEQSETYCNTLIPPGTSNIPRTPRRPAETLRTTPETSWKGLQTP